jgi:hypothetical protein
MPKKKSHPVAKQFSNEAMKKIKRYGQALSGGVTPFDAEVERHLARYEANRKKTDAPTRAAYQVHKGSDCKTCIGETRN